MKKRFLSILLVLVMLLGALPLTAYAENEQELQQQNDSEYMDLDINDEEDFKAWAGKIKSGDSTYSETVIHIRKDLNFKSPEGKYFDWKSQIGEGNTFEGIIDGHGHTISGLLYSDNNNDYSGLLGGRIKGGEKTNSKYGANAGVFNLAIVDCEIDVDTDYTGALFGSAESESGTVKFENIYVDISITSTGKYAGGLLGYGASDVIMSNCVFVGDMNITSGGGLIGAYGISTKGKDIVALVVEKSAFYGKLDISDGADAVGAMLGDVGRSSGGRKATVHYKDIIIGDKISEYIKGVVAANCYKDTTLSYENIYSAVSGNWCGGGEGSYPEGKISAVARDTLVGVKANVPDGFVTLPWGYAMPRGVVNFSRTHTEMAEKTGASTKYVGFQTTAEDDTYFNIRLSAVTNDGKEGATLDGIYAIGFEIEMRAEIGGTEKIWSNSTNGVAPTVSKVFTSVIGKDDNDKDTRYRATDLGGDYIFVACVTGVRRDLGDVTFTVKTFHDDESGKRVWDDVYVFGFDN